MPAEKNKVKFAFNQNNSAAVEIPTENGYTYRRESADNADTKTNDEQIVGEFISQTDGPTFDVQDSECLVRTSPSRNSPIDNEVAKANSGFTTHVNGM